MEKSAIRLGYAGFRGDLDAWEHFAGRIYGLQPVRERNVLRLWADERGDPVGLDYLGFEFGSLEALQLTANRLQASGFEATADADLAQRRNVASLIKTQAPDGTRLELFVGALTLSAPFASPTGARFVTGRSGLGHVLLLVPDIGAALAFFENCLGFSRSDVVVMGPGVDAHFLNGGHRHHVVALASLPGVTGFDHIFLEVDSVGTVGLAWDKVLAGAAPVARSLGQHANDPAMSFYAQSPSGFLFEYGCGSTIIGDPDSWIQTRWESPYLWGGTCGSHCVRS